MQTDEKVLAEVEQHIKECQAWLDGVGPGADRRSQGLSIPEQKFLAELALSYVRLVKLVDRLGDFAEGELDNERQ